MTTETKPKSPQKPKAKTFSLFVFTDRPEAIEGMLNTMAAGGFEVHITSVSQKTLSMMNVTGYVVR